MISIGSVIVPTLAKYSNHHRATPVRGTVSRAGKGLKSGTPISIVPVGRPVFFIFSLLNSCNNNKY